MRIVLVTNGLRYGGAERVVETLAHAFRDQGDRVHVVATTRGGPIRDSLQKSKIPISVLSIKSPYDVRVPFKLARVARKFGADVIHSHLAVADIATAATALLLPKVRIITMVHNTGIELDTMKLMLWRTSLKRFHRILAVSEPVRRALPEPIRSETAVVRPSSISAKDKTISRAEAREKLGLDPARPVVIAVGRLVFVKGFDVLAHAAGLLETRGAQILVFGDGLERARLSESGQLDLRGSRPDVADLLPAADLVVSSSRSEGFPQVILHAMAAGVPIVATRVGGTPEIVVHEQTGLLVPPEEPVALAKAMDDLLSHPAKAHRLGAEGRKRLIRAGFTKESMVVQIRSAYDAVLQSRTRWFVS